MDKPRLNIIRSGSNFIFLRQFIFEAGKGYKLTKSHYSRKFSLIDKEGVNSLLQKAGLDRYKDKTLVITDSKIEFSNIKNDFTCLIDHPNNWQGILKNIETSLNIGKLGFLSLESSRISLVTYNQNISNIFKFGLTHLPREYQEVLKAIDYDYSNLLNSIYLTMPLPQVVVDYHKSFVLGYIYGEIISNSLDFSDIDYLVISSEMILSGFIDQSGFIEGFKTSNKNINQFSFDTNLVWKSLFSGGFDDELDLRYMNKNNFLPEISLIKETLKDNAKIIVTNEGQEREMFYQLNIQNIIDLQGESKVFIGKQTVESINKIYVNAGSLSIKNITSLEFFRNWYKFYKYQSYNGDFIISDYKETIDHNVDIDLDLVLSSDKDTIQYKYLADFNNFSNKKSKLNVVVGQRVSKGDLLARREDLGGIVNYNLKSMHDGIIDFIDSNNKWIHIQVNKKNIKNKFQYKIIKQVNKSKVNVNIFGRKMNGVYAQGKSTVARLNKYSTSNTESFGAYWFEQMPTEAQIRSFLAKINEQQPSLIILPGIDINILELLRGENDRYLEMYSIICLNGYGVTELKEHQKKLFGLSEEKYILFSQYENSIYILESKGKFESDKAPFTFEKYYQIYTYDDWNLRGFLIYNDEDSYILKLENGLVLDVAEFNIIRMNNE